jgi:hypothetical protein
MHTKLLDSKIFRNAHLSLKIKEKNRLSEIDNLRKCKNCGKNNRIHNKKVCVICLFS